MRLNKTSVWAFALVTLTAGCNGTTEESFEAQVQEKERAERSEAVLASESVASGSTDEEGAEGSEVGLASESMAVEKESEKEAKVSSTQEEILVEGLVAAPEVAQPQIEATFTQKYIWANVASSSLYRAFLGPRSLSVAAYNCRRLGRADLSEAIIAAALRANPVLRDLLAGQNILTVESMMGLGSSRLDEHPATHWEINTFMATDLQSERTLLGGLIDPPTSDMGPDNIINTADDFMIQYIRWPHGHTQYKEWVVPAGTRFNSVHPPLAVDTPMQRNGWGNYIGALRSATLNLRALGKTAEARLIEEINIELLALLPQVQSIPGTFKRVVERNEISDATKAQYPTGYERILHPDRTYEE